VLLDLQRTAVDEREFDSGTALGHYRFALADRVALANLPRTAVGFEYVGDAVEGSDGCDDRASGHRDRLHVSTTAHGVRHDVPEF
jgi:hypothetical protein